MADTSRSQQFNLKIDLRWVVAALLLMIAGMVALWRPWQGRIDANSRTVQVTGQATITAVPDEFVFYPTYQFADANKDTALAALTKKSDEIVNQLKKLGVADEKIKTNSGGYDYQLYATDGKTATYTLTLTVTAGNKDLAQKVQDYLVTTAPTGSVSPQANFSHKKQQELENQARDTATKDARAKADQSAKNLGFRVGKVKAVKDDAGFGGIIYSYGGNLSSGTAPAPEKLALQPGENEITYTVTVTYFVR